MNIREPGYEPASSGLYPGVWNRQAFRLNDQVFMMYINREHGYADPEEWFDGKLHNHTNVKMPPELLTACNLWVKKDFGLPLFEFLQAMFNEV
jgi:hypothetical protein